ncbi:hypothetical protein KIH27_00165 [Mycobacterium sp. M1]|uniref:Uncharacterized protein n=1 Tax=Mycolicibacter acidiphilus TaxID=2835306 RepID=A0ABS5REK3_9MYCO|nr:hypothetical protein [Mycolicibacter acidiphilus]MBS9531998.1 hypothetical protein [Mycolicibacter acidiphilus]
MLGAIAIVPSAPVLVPELTGAGAAAELSDLRSAVCAAAGALPARWVAVGAGAADAVFGPDAAGTFAGFGVDVPVRLAPDAGRATDLPLCALLAGWLRGLTRPDATVEVRVYGPDTDADAGQRLRAEIDAAPEPVGVLVIADGANTLTPAAPGGHHPDDVAVQDALDAALAAGDTAALARQPEQVVGRAAWAVLAGLTEPGPRSVTVLYRDAPYGVGYFAGVWQP